MKNKIVSLILTGLTATAFVTSCSTTVNTDKPSSADSVIPEPAPVTAPVTVVKDVALWTDLPKENFKQTDTAGIQFKNYKLFALDSLKMRNLLAKAPSEKQRNTDSLKLVLELPRPDGGFMKFSIYRTTVMDPAMEAQYPLLRTYGGQGIDDRTANVRLDFNQNGFHAYITSQAGEWFIDPAARGITHQYLFCYFKRDVIIKNRKPFELPDSPRH